MYVGGGGGGGGGGGITRSLCLHNLLAVTYSAGHKVEKLRW